MKAAYLDLFSGVSGDMILGALVDLGLDFELLKDELSKLPVEGYRLKKEKVLKQDISGTSIVVEIEESDTHRHKGDIFEIIDNSSLEDEIKEKSRKVFTELAEAEADVHGISPDEVHFHEVGALDSIIDIVGGVIGFYHLGIDTIFASRVHTGTGFIEIEHGTIPVPAPATLGLLSGMPVYSRGIEHELVTPTGAAFLKVFVDHFGPFPSMRVESTGYGAGSRDLSIPNLLRIVTGSLEDNKKKALWK